MFSRNRFRWAAFYRSVWPLLAVVLAVSLACSLPGKIAVSPSSTSGPTAATSAPTSLPPTPSAPPPSLPPALVESSPQPGAELPLDSDVTLYFNQPMDQASVEAALTTGSSIGGKLTWLGTSTLVFKPAAALPPESDLVLAIGQNARALNGLALLRPVEVRYRTAGFLRSAQLLPEPGAVEIDPASAVLLTFNRPVVPLGADPASLPAAFSLDPQAAGTGSWVNTSTYIFYPKPALGGGQSYTVHINPDLHSTDGGPLQDLPAWSFTTALPKLVSAAPAGGETGIFLDAPVRLQFNQLMDLGSLQASFKLADAAGQAVPGASAWDSLSSTFVFTPTQLLQRGVTYSVQLEAAARSAGGSALGTAFQASWQTVGAMALLSHSLAVNGVLPIYSNISFDFSAALPESGFEKSVHLDPPADNLSFYVDQNSRTLYVNANFKPATFYTLQFDAAFSDRWGGQLNTPYSLPFVTGDLFPVINFPMGGDTVFMTPQDAGVQVQAVNVFSAPASFGSASLTDYLRTLGPNGYQFRSSFRPADARAWQAALNTQSNVAKTVNLDLTQKGEPLAPGLYWLNLQPPTQPSGQSMFLVVSNIQLTFKISPSDVLVWAVDLRTHAPLPGTSVVVYDETGAPLTAGFTGDDGVFQAGIALQKDPYSTYTAVLGQPGSDNFSLALSSWSQGVGPYAFGVPVDYRGPGQRVYLYTDRPIYRPGDTVYFRLAARQILNGRYSLPADLPSLAVKVSDTTGGQIANLDLPLSAFGTAHGSYKLFAGAAPGFYQINAGSDAISFQVADYRKPEINLEASLASTDVIYGQPLKAQVSARYFFDAPAGGARLHWALYAKPASFYVPNYQVGPLDTSWLEAFTLPSGGGGQFGSLLAEGDTQTGPDGLAGLELPTTADAKLVDPTRRQAYTLEVTLTDESGLPVSTHQTAQVHPGALYIGAAPDHGVGAAGQALGFSVIALDFAGKPNGAHALHADFVKVTWQRSDPQPGELFSKPTFTPQYTPAGTVDFTTSADGMARLEFTPTEAGTYQLNLAGENALTQLMVWISGSGEIAWPEIPNQRLLLTADKAGYKAGESAAIFVPNPFPAEGLALLTVERGVVMRHQVASIPAGGGELQVALEAGDSPNIFIAVTLLAQGDHPDFRQGYLELPVDPAEQVLQVDLSVTPERAGPGEQVEIALQAHDSAGRPVQGEFSLSVVDEAVLALADPNSSPIVPAYYSEQPLAVRTGLSLAAYINRTTFNPGGLGGGGGAVAPSVARENFPDTAFWQADLLTDAAGQAKASLTLPDSLTTWQVEARGLTADTRVGQAQAEIITSKDLLVRPVAPRFLVAGDHVQLAAILQNNTTTDLPVTASLQAGGVTLDANQDAAQMVNVPASGRARLEWWGTVQDVRSADLLFSARAGSLQDVVRLANGQLPVLHYSSPQAFATSGVLEGSGLQMELVSLPASYPSSANPADELRIELAPSLAAAMIGSLSVRQNFSPLCTEQVVSSFLPNLETYRLLQGLGFQSTETQASLEANIRSGLLNLLNDQQGDGGWSWWQGDPSDTYMTSYALFALLHAQEAGMGVPGESIARATGYLTASLTAPATLAEGWQLDRLAFSHFVLARAGKPDSGALAALYGERARLNPWARALLALAFDAASSGSQESLTLFSDLQSEAQRSALGAVWQETDPSLHNMHTTLSNSAVVAYALAQHDPAAPLLTDAVRYLMANRRAGRTWATSFSSSWALLAINGYIKGTGELNASFDFSASLNGESVLNGQAGGDTRLNPVGTVLPAGRLFPGAPNALAIQRGEGPGRLYYTAILDISQPVTKATPLSAGLSVSRLYSLGQGACPESGCTPVAQAKVGQPLTVHVNLTVPKDAYFVRLEDYIPAGAEILDLNLKTSQQGQEGEQTVSAQIFDPRQPFLHGWAWWLFSRPEIYADHIAYNASFLPAGAYELTYTLNLLQAGEFQVLPAHAWEQYFPDVQGSSAGSVFTITP